MKEKRLRYLLLMVCMLLCSTTLHAQEPYAVLSEDNTVLTFYYDTQKAERGGMDVGPFNGSPTWYKQRSTITTVVFDVSFAECTSLASTGGWFINCSNLTTITGIENLKTDNVTSMSYMFSGCKGLTSLDVSGFKTDNVTNMSGMFYRCSGLTSLDVSGFKTDNVTDMSDMFGGCKALTTIYAGDGWSTEKVRDGSSMFSGCTNLVGGEGTAYDENHTDYTYARIDGGTEAPGYFTYKASQPTMKGVVNGDLTVDVADIASVIDCMAGSEAVDKQVADVNGDGTVDVADIATIISEMAARARQQEIKD